MLYKLTKESTPRYPRVVPFKAIEHSGKSVDTWAERYSAATANIHQIQERAEAAEESEGDNDEDVRNGNLLMVDQLWLWAIDTSESA